jgi:transmembrane sensor
LFVILLFAVGFSILTMQAKTYYTAQLITKYLRGTLNGEENIALQEWLDEKPENRELLESFRESGQVQEELDFFGSLDIETAWERFNKGSGQSRSNWKILRYIAYAAAVILISTFSWMWLRQSGRLPEKAVQSAAHRYDNDVLPGNSKAKLVLSDGRTVELEGHPDKLAEKDGTRIVGKDGEIKYNNSRPRAQALIYNTLMVPKAGTYRLVLPDGTKIWVNALSELRFPVHFGLKQRKVYLSGEAYFEVAHDAARPFVVEVNGTTVEVLGTHFNVNSYTKTTTTTLLEGSVKVANKTGHQLLVPGQQAEVGESIHIQQANINKAIAWKSGDFYFKSDSMTEIMEELSRWYDVDVHFEGGVPDKKGYSGNISRDVNLSEVLEMLSYVSGARFDVKGRTISVRF